jgi:dipeptidyl aminopeptidase/acylaminoacyl peptidase
MKRRGGGVSTPGKSPVLFIHPDDDRNVAFNQTVTVVEALRAQGVELEELIFPDEVHDFLWFQHWIIAVKAPDAFFARKLRP